MMLAERRLRVLEAVVTEYVATSEPVGSKTLVQNYDLGVSSATVRSDLASLEESGHLVQPHVSAGRIPTDLGYRTIVDDFLARSRFGDATRTAVAAGPDEAAFDGFSWSRQPVIDVGAVLKDLSLVLSEQTDCLALVSEPTFSQATIERVSLVPIGPGRVVLVFVTDDGQVANRTLDAEYSTTAEVSALERRLNLLLVGQDAASVSQIRLDPSQAGFELQDTVVKEACALLSGADTKRMHQRGIVSLLRQPEFQDATRATPLMAALEEADFAFRELVIPAEHGIVVRIGHELKLEQLRDISIVAQAYSSGGAGGLVALVGPTRMDYPRTIEAVAGAVGMLEHLLEV